jgi:hemerythrin-like domain-containing protein
MFLSWEMHDMLQAWKKNQDDKSSTILQTAHLYAVQYNKHIVSQPLSGVQVINTRI